MPGLVERSLLQDDLELNLFLAIHHDDERGGLPSPQRLSCAWRKDYEWCQPAWQQFACPDRLHRQLLHICVDMKRRLMQLSDYRMQSM